MWRSRSRGPEYGARRLTEAAPQGQALGQAAAQRAPAAKDTRPAARSPARRRCARREIGPLPDSTPVGCRRERSRRGPGWPAPRATPSRSRCARRRPHPRGGRQSGRGRHRPAPSRWGLSSVRAGIRQPCAAPDRCHRPRSGAGRRAAGGKAGRSVRPAVQAGRDAQWRPRRRSGRSGTRRAPVEVGAGISGRARYRGNGAVG